MQCSSRIEPSTHHALGPRFKTVPWVKAVIVGHMYGTRVTHCLTPCIYTGLVCGGNVISPQLFYLRDTYRLSSIVPGAQDNLLMSESAHLYRYNVAVFLLEFWKSTGIQGKHFLV